jgi:tetratricopeptide (TPR) repeat protein
MRMLCAITTLVFGFGLAGPAGAKGLQEYLAQCSGNNNELVIEGCTAVLRASGLSRANKSAAYVMRGSAYARQGDPGLAIGDFTDAIRRNPRSLVAYYNRGNVYFAQESFDLAIADFSSAISLQPGHVLSYNNRGNAYLAKGEIDRAIAEFDKALEIDPKNTQAASNRAISYAKKGDVGGVIRNFGAAVSVFFRSFFGSK